LQRQIDIIAGITTINEMISVREPRSGSIQIAVGETPWKKIPKINEPRSGSTKIILNEKIKNK